MRVVLPVPLLLLTGFVVLDIRTDRICEQQIQASALAPEWERHGPTRAALIGDSWAAADGIHPAYPALVARALDLDMRVSAVGGTGYTNGGACGGKSFQSRVHTVPDDARLVILAGGLNDTGSDGDDLSSALRRVVAAVHLQAPAARIVVLGVPRVPLLDDRRTERADGILRSASGTAFVDVRGWSIPTLPDRIHPTPSGHREYARHIVAALR